jgi:hypothetical protein
LLLFEPFLQQGFHALGTLRLFRGLVEEFGTVNVMLRE